VNASTESGIGAGNENQNLICVDVHHENDNVATYTFATQRKQLWAFQPGQFLTFDIPNKEQWIRRSYSISSTPSHPYTLDVTVKKLTGGYASHWFHENMKVGKEIIARGPHGQFSLFEAKREKLLFMVAGVGITPMMSMLRWLVDTRAPNDVIVFNRVHSIEDAIFVDELAGLEKRSKGRIRLITMSSIPSADWPHSLNVLDGSRTGLISPETISFLANDLQERDVFLCGPDSFMADVKHSLAALNFSFDHLHYESFIGINNAPRGGDAISNPAQGAASPSSILMAADIPEELQCQVEFKHSGKTVICQKGDNLLDVAEFYGIDIANSCRMGSCGSCKCVKVSGDIEMMNSQGLSEAEKASHHVLLCVGSANSASIVLDA
jgi:ferredoxin-NADP reductase